MAGSGNSFKESWRPIGVDALFGFDWRSLAFFRIAIGSITIADVIRRSLDFTAHYTNLGVLPSSVLLERFHRPALMNLYALFEPVGWQVFLAVLTILTSLAVIFGFFTRIAWFVSWLLVLSIQHRNEWITNGGDVVFRLFYFWGLFLPLGARYSIDSLWRKNRPWEAMPRYFSMATLGLSIQIAFLYFLAAVLKSDPDWHANATAIFYALHLDKYATPIAVALREHTELLKVMTTAVWYFEFLAPWFLFVPFFFNSFRTATTLALMGMHLAFVSCLRIGTFPWICISGLCVMLPSGFWETLGHWGKLESIRRWIAEKIAVFGDRLLGSRAGKILKEYFSLVEKAPSLFWLGNLAAGAALLVVIFWNIGGIPGTGITLPRFPAHVSRLFGLDQHWDMFAARPTRSDGWIVVPGELENGKPVDVWYLDESPVSWKKQTYIAYNFTSERWIKFFEAMYEKKEQLQIESFANYECRKWNSTFPAADRLKSLEVYYMDDPTLPTGKGTPVPVSLGKFTCSP